MSRLQRKVNYLNGIHVYIRKLLPNIILSKRKFNKIMISYLKSKEKNYFKWNNRYKGINTADLLNAELIQNDFHDFAKWIKNNLDLIKNQKL